MWVHHLNPTLIDFGPVEIRWYGLVYVLGFFLGVYWLHYATRKRKLELDKDGIWDLMFYLMLGVIIGSRLFEIFWEPAYYLSNPLRLLKIWEGGMSFHGGLVGIVTAAWLYCKKKKINFYVIGDILAVPAIFALALGRIANFVNGELVGRVWNGPWCVVFPSYDELCRYPSMIYATIQRLIVFSWLLWLSFFGKFRQGFIFWNFVFWEGLGRIVVDFFREDILYLGLSIGQWFSLVMVVAASYMFIKYYKEDWRSISNINSKK